MDLFDSKKAAREPLAARMRPRTLDEYIGQDHIVGKGRLLRRAIAADQLTSVIFYGPPGTGKTTLARVIANHTKSNFLTLNAVLTGVKDIREAIETAETQRKMYGRRTILFVDEVHRWNRAQQDALLPWVENGTLILVGATTENPFFEVNKALVSRSRIFQLKALEKADLEKAAAATLADKERGYGRWRVEFEDGALDHLIETANGDARSLLNALELAVETTPEKWFPDDDPPVPPDGSVIYISKEAAEESIQKKVVLYDRDGDYHYDIISAFIKSLRGRDPDAAMYWMARMVAAGEDPHFIFRRMLISACEDTGLADPTAISIVESSAAAFDRVGLPEGRYFLAHAALYLSTAPKSNSSMAFFDALSSVEKEDKEVPNPMRDDNRDAEEFGHGAGYLYPHAYRDHWVAQQYLPDDLMGRVFYTPSDQGYEAHIRADVLSRRELQIAALLEKTEKPDGEHEWQDRLDSNRADVLLEIRNAMLSAANLLRNHRVFIWNADDALLLMSAVRACPEGAVCGVCRSEKGRAVLEQYVRTLEIEDIDKPLLTIPDVLPSAGAFFMPFHDIPFDRLFFRDIFVSPESITQFNASLETALTNGQLASGWKCIIAQRIPANGQRLSALIRGQILQNREGEEGKYAAVLNALETAEKNFYSDPAQSLFAWNADTIISTLTAGTVAASVQTHVLYEKRRLTPEEVQVWFNAEKSPYGKAVRNALGDETEQILTLLLEATQNRQLFEWKTEVAIVTISILNRRLVRQ
jgi:putative ATPase